MNVLYVRFICAMLLLATALVATTARAAVPVPVPETVLTQAGAR